VLKPGGFACINIGDATRTLKQNFALYTNHARILKFAQELGFSALPCILWRKQTNAPNKFVGSGMMPAGAYVTLEHEYILVLRKGGKREFASQALKKNRRSSAFFWEERNLWFSDIWFDIKGTVQAIADKDTRKRSAAYPFELAYRLINMYSAKKDLVLDPYLGMGTTTSAAMASGRNSVGYEIDPGLEAINLQAKEGIIQTAQQVIHQRLVNHLDFVVQRTKSKGRLKHENIPYGFPVMTTQEKELLINQPLEIQSSGKNIFTVEYASTAQPEFCRDWTNLVRDDDKNSMVNELKDQGKRQNFKQQSLF
jgi:DNA modification methylase